MESVRQPDMHGTDSSPESVTARQYYDQLAKDFEQQNEFWDNPYDAEVWRLEHALLADHLDLHSPLLDLGCGFYPHDLFDTKLRIVAGDLSFCSLIVARRSLPPDRKVTLLEFDAHHLPFSDGAFCQAIAGGELLNHVDYHGVLSELARVLCTNGVLLVEFGTKWCLDSMWALLDTLLGHRIGYSVTRDEAKYFMLHPSADAEVTWEITPGGQFKIKLLTVKNVKRTLAEAGFEVKELVSTNLLSGLVPLPYQQDSERRFAQKIATLLIKCDQLFGKVPLLNQFAGNVFMLCYRR